MRVLDGGGLCFDFSPQDLERLSGDSDRLVVSGQSCASSAADLLPSQLKFLLLGDTMRSSSAGECGPLGLDSHLIGFECCSRRLRCCQVRNSAYPDSALAPTPPARSVRGAILPLVLLGPLATSQPVDWRAAATSPPLLIQSPPFPASSLVPAAVSRQRFLLTPGVVSQSLDLRLPRFHRQWIALFQIPARLFEPPPVLAQCATIARQVPGGEFPIPRNVRRCGLFLSASLAREANVLLASAVRRCSAAANPRGARPRSSECRARASKTHPRGACLDRGVWRNARGVG